MTDDELLPIFASRDVDGETWFEIVADTHGSHGWVMGAGTPVGPAQQLGKYTGYTTPFWDGRIYKQRGYGKSKSAPFRKKQPAFHILETWYDKNNEQIWFRVEFSFDECAHNRYKKLGTGWLPWRNSEGEIQLWYELSC